MPLSYMTSSVVILLVIMVTSVVRSAKLKENQKRGFITGADDNFKWIDGKVPFCFEKFNKISETNGRIIENAMAEIMLKSCIKFVPRYSIDGQCEIDACTPIDDAMKQSRMLVITGAHPGSYVEDILNTKYLPCRRINFDYRCIQRPRVLHHLMHALGFGHEDARRDRDQYIKMDVNNKSNRYCERPNKYDDFNGKMDVSSTNFDPFSIMTSGKNEFRDVDPDQLGDLPITLSPTDVLELNKIYNCDVCVNFDDDFKCTRWAMRYRYCSSSYMQTYCKKSCKLCNEPPMSNKLINESIPRPTSDDTSAIIEETVVSETKIPTKSATENETATTEIPDTASQATSQTIPATTIFPTTTASEATSQTIPVTTIFPTTTASEATSQTIPVTTIFPTTTASEATSQTIPVSTILPTTTNEATSQTIPMTTIFPTTTASEATSQTIPVSTILPTTTNEATSQTIPMTTIFPTTTASEATSQTIPVSTILPTTTNEATSQTIPMTTIFPTTTASEATSQTISVSTILPTTTNEATSQMIPMTTIFPTTTASETTSQTIPVSTILPTTTNEATSQTIPMTTIFPTTTASESTSQTIPVSTILPTTTNEATSQTIPMTTIFPTTTASEATSQTSAVTTIFPTTTSEATSQTIPVTTIFPTTTTSEATSHTIHVTSVFPTTSSNVTVHRIATVVTSVPTATTEETMMTDATNELTTTSGSPVSETTRNIVNYITPSEETRTTPTVATSTEILATTEMTMPLPTTVVSNSTEQTSGAMIELATVSIATSEAIGTTTGILAPIQESNATATKGSKTVSPTAIIPMPTSESNGSDSEMITVPPKVTAVIGEATNASATRDNDAE